MVVYITVKKITLLLFFINLFTINFTILDNLRENFQLYKKWYFPKIGRKRPGLMKEKKIECKKMREERMIRKKGERDH